MSILSLLLTSCIHLFSGAKQPNIIFLMTDSMDGRNMDPTSNQYSLIDMPNLRNVANEGVQFVRTYTSSPQCDGLGKNS